MPHPVRVLCAVHRTLVPCQPHVRPSLGDALVLDAERAARAPALVGEALQAAPWCAVVLLVRGSLVAGEFATLHRELPAGAAVVRGDFESSGPVLADAVRNRGAPSMAELLGYLDRRRLSRALIGAVDDALCLSDSDSDHPKPASQRRATNRRLAEFGPLRVGHWRRLARLLALTEVTSAAGLDQRAWEAGLDPRSARAWAVELCGIELAAAATCPGWEWKVEGTLRRHGYLPWASATRRLSGVLERPMLATA